MSKILYIEDELTKHISTIKKFFLPILTSRGILSQLDELEKSAPFYANDIVTICNKVTELDVCYKFQIALYKIVHNHPDYDLIIIDRNLSTYDYSKHLGEITDYLNFAGLSNAEEKASEYHEREGDLLLLVLLSIDPSSRDKIFFLAANTQDSIHNSVELETIIDITHFSTKRILEKGTAAENVISEIVADFPTFAIQNRYREQCSILRKRLSEETVNLFISIAKLSDNVEQKIDFLQKLRPLTEKFLVTLANKINDTKAMYWDRYHGKISLKEKDFINSLEDVNNRYRIGYNKNIRQCLYSLWQIPSDFASHTSGNPDDITIYTVTALLNQLCDVILWFDLAMENVK